MKEKYITPKVVDRILCRSRFCNIPVSNADDTVWEVPFGSLDD